MADWLCSPVESYANCRPMLQTQPEFCYTDQIRKSFINHFNLSTRLKSNVNFFITLQSWKFHNCRWEVVGKNILVVSFLIISRNYYTAKIQFANWNISNEKSPSVIFVARFSVSPSLVNNVRIFIWIRLVYSISIFGQKFLWFCPIIDSVYLLLIHVKTCTRIMTRTQIGRVVIQFRYLS